MADVVPENTSTEGGPMVNLSEIHESLDKIMAPSAFVSSLPKPVQRRLRALKNLQKETFEVETKFFEELHELEAKYEQMFAPMFEKRCKIVTGKVEPTEDECQWVSDEETGSDDADTPGADVPAADVKGIPNFWLQIFKNVDILADIIQPCDEPILKHLIDVRVKTMTSTSPPAGYTLEFVFEPNEYFTNEILTKDYFLRFDLDKEDPLEYDGPEVTKCKGCAIDWKSGMDVTKKKVKKTQQHRNHGAKRTIVKTVPSDSFFNFFSPPEVAEGTEPDDLTDEILSNDFEVGHFLRDQVIPKALLFFTGDALEYDDDDEEAGSGDPSADEM